MKSYCLYCLTLKSDGRKYFGITSRPPKKRWGYGYGYEAFTHIGAAIRKYGWDAFSHEVLLEGLTKEEAVEKEKWYIKTFDTTNGKKGFNVTAGGDGVEGYAFSEEAKKRLSDAHKGKYHTEKQKERISSSLKEYYKTHSVSVPYSHIMRMVEARKGLPSPLLGRTLSEETKEKIRSANIGKKASEETKMKMRASAKKRKVVLLDANGNTVNIFNSIRDAARSTNCPSGHISECCQKKRKHCKQLKFEYYE